MQELSEGEKARAKGLEPFYEARFRKR
jgi:hypothetical protein